MTRKSKGGKGERDGSGRFVPGHAGGPGRPLGSANRSTLAGREVLAALEAGDAELPPVFDRWKRLLRDADPTIRLGAERELFRQRYGNPAQAVGVSVGVDINRAIMEAHAEAMREDVEEDAPARGPSRPELRREEAAPVVPAPATGPETPPTGPTKLAPLEAERQRQSRAMADIVRQRDEVNARDAADDAGDFRPPPRARHGRLF